MKMPIRIRCGSRLPTLLKVDAITLYPYIFFAETFPKPILVRHELVHCMQVERDGWIKFYAKYLWDYLKNLIIYRDSNTAYLMIPYEVEAHNKAESGELVMAEIT